METASERVTKCGQCEYLTNIPGDLAAHRRSQHERSYEIVKFSQGKPGRVQRSWGRVTLADARRICQGPDTKGDKWFLGFRSI